MLAVEMSLGIERLDMSVQKEKGASISMKVFRIFHHHPIKFLACGGFMVVCRLVDFLFVLIVASAVEMI